MIKVFPKEREENSKELIQRVKEANNISNNIISHFFELLGYDSNLFKHLYNIDIIIGYGNIIKKDEVAHYEFTTDEKHNKNRIVIDGNYIEESDSLNDLVVTLIHEKLHANRDVLLKTEINYANIDDYIDYNSLSNEDKKLYHELFNLLENKRLNNKYKILKISNFKDYSYVYIYNKERRSFEIYKLNDLNINYKNINKSYKDIINYIISNNIEPIKSIYNYKNFNDEEIYEITGIYPINGSFNTEEIALSSYLIKYQKYLEEALIETIAMLMYYHREKNSLDIDEFCTNARNRWTDPSILNAIKIISKAKEKFISDFLLSSYQDEFKNVLEKTFLNDYLRLVKSFYNIYRYDLQSKRSLYDEFSIDEIVYRRLK